MHNNICKSEKGRPNEFLTIFIRARGEIRINKSVVLMLDNPDHIQFWWSKREKTLLFSAVNEKTPVTISIPHSCNRRKNGVRFTNRELLRAICVLTGWQDGTEHRLIGEFVPELDMVAFRISDAVSEVLINA